MISATAAGPAARIGAIAGGARGLARRVRGVGFGFVAQACSSATNFGLAVIAGHTLGPGGLGSLFVAFAAYFVLLGFERALITDPLVARTSSRDAAERAASARDVMTLALVAATIAAAAFAAIGVAVPGRYGRALLLFAPWLVPALVQDLGRALVFRDRQGRATAASDATWLGVMVVTAPIAFLVRDDWVVTAVWGLGAVAGAAVALRQLRWQPVPVGRAFSWWRSNVWGLGRWLGGQQVLYSSATFATVTAMAAILGAADYGGFRAVQAILAPLTLLAPAIALPGLPLVSRAAAASSRRALGIAVQFAALITAATCAYVLLLYLVPGLLSVFFGHAFLDFRSIIVPIGVGQIIAAPAFGLTLLLMAEQRGRALLVLGALNATLYLAFATGLGAAFGLDGAAWAYAGSSAIGEAALLLILRRRARAA